jgi:hypothetical protein
MVVNKLPRSGQIFENYSSAKFNENPSSGSRVVPCGRTGEWTGRSDEVIVAFRNFAKAPKINSDKDFMTEDSCQVVKIRY